MSQMDMWNNKAHWPKLQNNMRKFSQIQQLNVKIFNFEYIKIIVKHSDFKINMYKLQSNIQNFSFQEEVSQNEKFSSPRNTDTLIQKEGGGYLSTMIIVMTQGRTGGGAVYSAPRSWRY